MKNRMKTYGFWFYEELHPFIGWEMPAISLTNAHGEQFRVTMSSTRLECFRRTPKCAHCGLQGALFLLQSHKDEKPHLNLYAVTRRVGDLVLMTQDHIFPKSKGGSSEQYNLQTMCTICNKAKGSDMPMLRIRVA